MSSTESQTKTCQNCKNDFVIEPDDFSFYEKIKVPAPTFCPECRMIRRAHWRNVRSLYRRNCGLCNKSLISMYSDKNPAPVYCKECWYRDGWNQLSCGKEYDFSRTFFEQLKELFNINPRFYSYKSGNLINSDYSNFSVDNKNVYLAYSIIGCEDVMYSETIEKSKNSIDNYATQKIEHCSYNIDCEGNYNTHYALKSRNCMDSYFIYDCVNCQNCCLCSNIRNKKYFYKNKQFTKEEYQKTILKLKLGTYIGFENTQKLFDLMLTDEAIHRSTFIFTSQSVNGDYINHSKNVKKSFDVWSSENVAYGIRITENSKDCYDSNGIGRNTELIYESLAASINTYKDSFCYITLKSHECEYSLILENCSNCFACVGLKNAEYCILNKQYTKDGYFILVNKIKKHMDKMPYIDKKGRMFKYGEFFPYDMSPFGYNETNAHDFFPIEKEEALEKGYFWKDKEEKKYNITTESINLPNDIKDIENNILNEIIGCPNNGDQRYQCTMAYKIMPEELSFYKQKNLPLPRYCPNCRHYQRLKYRNPFKLWHRSCMHEGCNNEFDTSYSPDRPEIVYCEKCYQQEVI